MLGADAVACSRPCMAPSSVLLECLSQAAIQQVIGPFATPSKAPSHSHPSLSEPFTPSYSIVIPSSPDPGPHCPSNQNLSHTLSHSYGGYLPANVATIQHATPTRRAKWPSLPICFFARRARAGQSHTASERIGVVLTKCAIFHDSLINWSRPPSHPAEPLQVLGARS